MTRCVSRWSQGTTTCCGATPENIIKLLFSNQCFSSYGNLHYSWLFLYVFKFSKAKTNSSILRFHLPELELPLRLILFHVPHSGLQSRTCSALCSSSLPACVPSHRGPSLPYKTWAMMSSLWFLHAHPFWRSLCESHSWLLVRIRVHTPPLHRGRSLLTNTIILPSLYLLYSSINLQHNL